MIMMVDLQVICLFGGGLIMAHCTLIMDVILPYVR